MINVENVGIWGFEHAIRGMRNPLNSWEKSDSKKCKKNKKTCAKCEYKDNCTYDYYIGPNDLDLMRRLYKAGPEHRKYLRQIEISMDITAPLYFFKEFDTYKVGTVSNSCSTMHKIAAKEFTLADFSHENLTIPSLQVLQLTIDMLNRWRQIYLEGGAVVLNKEDVSDENSMTFEPKNKIVWWQLIQLLPSSYNQRRTITMNYENAITMIKQRSGHKLAEWNTFVEVLKILPYVKEITEEKDEAK